MSASAVGPLRAITTHVTQPLPVWWTDADRAEWACLAHVLVQGAISHHERCSVCATGFRVCDGMRRAWQVADEWLAWRRLLSEALFLRAQLDAREAA